jgi:hypothetical protein
MNNFHPKFELSPKHKAELQANLKKLIEDEQSARESASKARQRRENIKFAIFVPIILFASTFLMVKTWSHVFSSIKADVRQERDRQASVWLDISEARQCFDYQGVRDGRMVVECKDGTTYFIAPAVVERAEQMRTSGDAQ